MALIQHGLDLMEEVDDFARLGWSWKGGRSERMKTKDQSESPCNKKSVWPAVKVSLLALVC